MKHLTVLLLVFFTLASHGADPGTFVYEGEVAGVMCSACSNHVETALKKLPGVRSVTIAPAKDGGLPKLEIIATSATITRDDAIKALGEQAKTYDVRTLKRVQKK